MNQANWNLRVVVPMVMFFMDEIKTENEEDS